MFSCIFWTPSFTNYIRLTLSCLEFSAGMLFNQVHAAELRANYMKLTAVFISQETGHVTFIAWLENKMTT